MLSLSVRLALLPLPAAARQPKTITQQHLRSIQSPQQLTAKKSPETAVGEEVGGEGWEETGGAEGRKGQTRANGRDTLEKPLRPQKRNRQEAAAVRQ